MYELALLMRFQQRRHGVDHADTSMLPDWATTAFCSCANTAALGSLPNAEAEVSRLLSGLTCKMWLQNYPPPQQQPPPPQPQPAEPPKPEKHNSALGDFGKRMGRKFLLPV